MGTVDFAWQCPVCADILNKDNNQWRCQSGHSFDCAKEGYVNLLLTQHKNSKSPGDNKAMVLARRAFLTKGFYRPLAKYIGNCLLEHNQKLEDCTASIKLFDAGCGEGFYLQRIIESLHSHKVNVQAAGIDISKPAVQKAAKLLPNVDFAVASSFNLPIPSSRFDAVIQIFAPNANQEVNRILNDTGIWITVDPGEDHLFELKRLVYDKPAKHTMNSESFDGFTESSSTRLSFSFDLDKAEDRENLLMMTPFYWSISEQKKQQVLHSLTRVTTDFSIKVWQKDNNG